MENEKYYTHVMLSSVNNAAVNMKEVKLPRPMTAAKAKQFTLLIFMGMLIAVIIAFPYMWSLVPRQSSMMELVAALIAGFATYLIAFAISRATLNKEETARRLALVDKDNYIAILFGKNKV